MKQVFAYSIAAAISLTVPVVVDAAPNGFQTEAMSATSFEVIPRARKDIDGYWCAAADFARRKLGAGWQQQIYVLRGYGPSVTTGRKTAVQFTLKKPSNVPQQGSNPFSPFKAGDSVSVQGANARCNAFPLLRG